LGNDLWNYTLSCHLKWKQIGFQKVNKWAMLKILCCAFRVAYSITYVGNESNSPYHHYLWITTNSFRSLFLHYRQCLLQLIFVTDSLKCYIWSIVFVVLQLGHFGKWIRNASKIFEICCLRRMGKTS